MSRADFDLRPCPCPFYSTLPQKGTFENMKPLPAIHHDERHSSLHVA